MQVLITFAPCWDGSKTFIKIAISLFLLICFSAVAIPVDLFHNHPEEEAVCVDYASHGKCTHKLHLSKKGPYCFACAIHIEKNFLVSFSTFFPVESKTIRVYIESNTSTSTSDQLLTFLRGPPRFSNFS